MASSPDMMNSVIELSSSSVSSSAPNTQSQRGAQSSTSPLNQSQNHHSNGDHHVALHKSATDGSANRTIASTQSIPTRVAYSRKNNSSSRLSEVAPLVAACSHLLQPNGSINGDQVAEAILPYFPDLCSALPAQPGHSANHNHNHNHDASHDRGEADSSYSSSHTQIQAPFANRQGLLGLDGVKRPLTHARIRQFILQELGPQLHQLGYGRGSRIALVLPNGPELALAILGVAHWASCLPLNANGAPSELKKDLKLAKPSLIVGMIGDDVSASLQDMANALKVPYCALQPSPTEVGVFHLIPTHLLSTGRGNNHASHKTGINNKMVNGDEEGPYCTMSCTETCQDEENFRDMDSMDVMFPNEHNDEVLVLFTSGTTGSKKLVPHKLGDMLIAAACIAVSWNLSPQDVNCNLMPLFHVGGIVRQVFAPILSAGSVICCPSFDPSIFWQLLLQPQPQNSQQQQHGLQVNTVFSWYYAAPTMHQVIIESMPAALKAAAESTGTTPKPKLRMIANAAGGLLPSLAEELRKAFNGANILPSYGMTECMPISSPPHNYQLTKPGTSGVAVGPQITIFNSNFEILPPGKEGSICVRGRPCFHGYGGVAPKETFLEGGWFNTGDLGYMDADGYIYITGRSKEVINRGGEIISPLEVEEEVRSHPSVIRCAAFSAPHALLQEVVGIVVVTAPNVPRLDLPALHEFLESRLTTAKWPQVLVFMDALPKSHTNKLLRVKLGQRLNLPQMNDGMFPVERTFDATCPPQGTPVGVSIPCKPVAIEPEQVQQVLREVFGVHDGVHNRGAQIVATHHPSRYGSLIVHATNLDRNEIIQSAKEALDAYQQPSHVCIHADSSVRLTPEGCAAIIPQSTDAVGFVLGNMGGESNQEDTMVHELQEMMQELIDLDCLPSPDTSFFQLGGTSLLASQFASRIRKTYKISFSGADVFRHNTCFAITSKIKSRTSTSPSDSGNKLTGMNGSKSTENAGAGGDGVADLQGIQFDARLEPKSEWLAAPIQLLPGFLVFPIWQLTRFYLLFMSLLEVLHRIPWERNFFKLVATVVVYYVIWNLVAPLFFVIIKWLVIGKYKKGRHAFYSFYYLRWWFVDVCRKIFGRGLWGSNTAMLVIYYRMLGADISWEARLNLSAEIAEYDLVTIGPDASIENATIRGFGVDNGAMILGPVVVGKSSSVGIRSVVAPYTRIPDGKHVGPGTSSYEIGEEAHLHYNRHAVPEPSFLMQALVCTPVTIVVDSIALLPALYVLYKMILMHRNQHDDGDFSFSTIGDLLEWLCEPARIPYYLGIRVVRATISPLLYMMGSLFVKWTIIGPFVPGPRDITSDWELTRHWLAATLFSQENVQAVTDLLGRHYELTSSFYRLLGARVGLRVFWPGHQPITSGEYDLLEIGDDVVFGSRTVICMSTTTRCEKVIFCAGANISDNAIVLPGSIIGKNAVIGSNTVCPAHRYIPPSSTWVGSQNGQPIPLNSASFDSDEVIYSKDVKASELEMTGDESTIRPFGRALGLREAKYFVFPGWMMSFFSILAEALSACFHSLPLLGTSFLTAAIIYGWRPSERDYSIGVARVDVYITMLFIFCGLHMLRVLLTLIFEVVAKWILLGQRQMGRYNWDESTYNQRWEFYQVISRIKRVHRISCLDFFSGSIFMDWYTRALGGSVGARCCLYPAGCDPFMPEPDLVVIGDRAVIDTAAIVCHLNTRGNFELVPIKVDAQSTVRSRCRVQQGVHMEAGSMLLEKSLALTGEVIESDTIWQGAPATRISEYQLDLGLVPSVSFGKDYVRSGSKDDDGEGNLEETKHYFELV
eukprot:CAMPEP_0113624862 /NCGR_PEP_ID=MMETSP0017_2-20120614/12831_1 /TAXON_ID=2856 /ORGANISM="Cylindrotheca closterium" /LENGTH=1800 /DNA_ID=CAMNT_0000534935 /DNA_START=213 /DNA_END=5615 /DNA_ORIENTATION=+ /assembly_acc=CAM_ASM_000147